MKTDKSIKLSSVIAAVKAELPTGVYTPRLKKHFEEVVRAEMTKQFGYKNSYEVPTIEKIVLNMGVGEAVNDTKKVTAAAGDLALIAGQKPVITRARLAISTFKPERPSGTFSAATFAASASLKSGSAL